MNRNYNSGEQSPVVVPEKATDHSSRLNRSPRSVSVGSPVVVPEKATDHSSRLNPQVYIRLQGIKTLLQNTNYREKGKGMLRAESLSCSHNEIQSLVVVAEGRLTIFPSFDRIPRTSLSGVRRSTINWQPHLSSEFDLLMRGDGVDIKTLSPENGSHINFIAVLGGSTADSVSNPIGV